MLQTPHCPLHIGAKSRCKKASPPNCAVKHAAGISISLSTHLARKHVYVTPFLVK